MQYAKKKENVQIKYRLVNPSEGVRQTKNGNKEKNSFFIFM